MNTYTVRLHLEIVAKSTKEALSIATALGEALADQEEPRLETCLIDRLDEVQPIAVAEGRGTL